jgi:hypothetical protein
VGGARQLCDRLQRLLDVGQQLGVPSFRVVCPDQVTHHSSIRLKTSAAETILSQLRISNQLSQGLHTIGRASAHMWAATDASRFLGYEPVAGLPNLILAFAWSPMPPDW